MKKKTAIHFCDQYFVFCWGLDREGVGVLSIEGSVGGWGVIILFMFYAFFTQTRFSFNIFLLQSQFVGVGCRPIGGQMGSAKHGTQHIKRKIRDVQQERKKTIFWRVITMTQLSPQNFHLELSENQFKQISLRTQLFTEFSVKMLLNFAIFSIFFQNLERFQGK